MKVTAFSGEEEEVKELKKELKQGKKTDYSQVLLISPTSNIPLCRRQKSPNPQLLPLYFPSLSPLHPCDNQLPRGPRRGAPLSLHRVI